jgi:hypothetical protein
MRTFPEAVAQCKPLNFRQKAGNDRRPDDGDRRPGNP